MKQNDSYTCCLCGKKKQGFGNNPWPLARSSEKCCDGCNKHKVIPARIELAKSDPWATPENYIV